jgi:hypothetical protein
VDAHNLGETVRMETVVAVRVTNDMGQARYFVTWGRIQDNVDGTKLEDLVLRFAASYQIGGKLIRADVCDSLREASGEPYFYEALLDFAGQPWGEDIDAWRARIAEEMEAGAHLYFLGMPR